MNNMEGLLFCMQSTFKGIPKQNKLKLNRNVHITEFYAYVSCIHSVVVEMNDKTPVKIEPF